MISVVHEVMRKKCMPLQMAILKDIAQGVRIEFYLKFCLQKVTTVTTATVIQ